VDLVSPSTPACVQLGGMIKRLGHLCLKTSQLDKMTAFYRDGLGATIQFRYLNRAGAPIGIYFALGEMTFIEVFDHADAHRRSGSTKPLEPLEDPHDPWLARYNHFCLQIDDLDAYVAEITARGVTVTGRKTGNDRSLQAWIKDPDGNLIELQQYTPQSRQLTREDFQEA
jgi:catechol 2,3-dioxygenase-like lactoylglutathione lyase family enzyme